MISTTRKRLAKCRAVNNPQPLPMLHHGEALAPRSYATIEPMRDEIYRTTPPPYPWHVVVAVLSVLVGIVLGTALYRYAH